jgi:hypothetical protein
MPVRIQRKRTKGWRAPTGVVNCTRPGKWGNPFRVGIDGTAEECVAKYRAKIDSNVWTFPTKKDIQEQLRGKDLMCFCGPDSVCHVDILLEIANK